MIDRLRDSMPPHEAAASNLDRRERHAEAQAAASEFLATVKKNRGYHHYTYYAARVYARAGNAAEAVRWLRYSAANVFPSYPLVARDGYFESIRNHPEFARFIEQLKQQFEGYRRQFG